MSRFVDRGAITAGWVGIGMAVTIAMSFLLIIPIEPIYWYLALPAGLLIGYYANARSERAGGPWRRIIANSLYAGLVTGLTYAAFLLVIKAIFFFADSGYPTFNRVDADGNPIPPTAWRRGLRVQPLPRDRARVRRSRRSGSPTSTRSPASTGTSSSTAARVLAGDGRGADRRGAVRVHQPARGRRRLGGAAAVRTDPAPREFETPRSLTGASSCA